MHLKNNLQFLFVQHIFSIAGLGCSCNMRRSKNQTICAFEPYGGNSSANAPKSQSRPSKTCGDCELEIQGLLRELHETIFATQKERDKASSNLETIQKAHEKMIADMKVTNYYKVKVKNLYTTALNDANIECDLLRKGLDLIAKIKSIQEEKRIIIRALEQGSDEEHPRKSMRRGVLMSLLQKAAQTLPLWIGKPNEKLPPLCGSIGAGSDYVAKAGDKVAAKVKSEDMEDQWILADVISFNPTTLKYEVDDIDEEGKVRHTLSKRRVVPLPQWKANPETDPTALHSKETLVLALYPQTTCFYRGVISEVPTTAHEEYSVLFEDNSYAGGYSPALCVAQKYIVVPKEMKDAKKR